MKHGALGRLCGTLKSVIKSDVCDIGCLLEKSSLYSFLCQNNVVNLHSEAQCVRVANFLNIQLNNLSVPLIEYLNFKRCFFISRNNKNAPLPVIIGSLNGFFTKLLKIHYSTATSSAALAQLVGVHPFFVRDYQTAAQNFSLVQVFKAITLLRIYDLKGKGVGTSGHVEGGELLRELIMRILC